MKTIYSTVVMPGLYCRGDTDLSPQMRAMFREDPTLEEIEVVDPCTRCDSVGECGGNVRGLSTLCPLH